MTSDAAKKEPKAVLGCEAFTLFDNGTILNQKTGERRTIEDIRAVYHTIQLATTVENEMRHFFNGATKE